MVFLSGLAGPSLKVGDDHNSPDAVLWSVRRNGVDHWCDGPLAHPSRTDFARVASTPLTKEPDFSVE